MNGAKRSDSVDLTPSPFSEGEGSRDTNFGASHPSPFGEGLGVRSAQGGKLEFFIIQNSKFRIHSSLFIIH
jgi:hypothetical protein